MTFSRMKFSRMTFRRRTQSRMTLSRMPFRRKTFIRMKNIGTTSTRIAFIIMTSSRTTLSRMTSYQFNNKPKSSILMSVVVLNVVAPSIWLADFHPKRHFTIHRSPTVLTCLLRKTMAATKTQEWLLSRA